jgi:hypothetical protein
MEGLIIEASDEITYISSGESIPASDLRNRETYVIKFVKDISLEVEKSAYLILNIIQTSYAAILK